MPTTDIAHDLGKKSFAAGARRIPAFDADLAVLMKGTDAKARIAVMSAWLAGWDRANLDAPLF